VFLPIRRERGIYKSLERLFLFCGTLPRCGHIQHLWEGGQLFTLDSLKTDPWTNSGSLWIGPSASHIGEKVVLQ